MYVYACASECVHACDHVCKHACKHVCLKCLWFPTPKRICSRRAKITPRHPGYYSAKSPRNSNAKSICINHTKFITPLKRWNYPTCCSSRPMFSTIPCLPVRGEIWYGELKYNIIQILHARAGKLPHLKWACLMLGIYGGRGRARRCWQYMTVNVIE